MINKLKKYLISLFFKSKSTLFDSIEEYDAVKAEEKELRFSFKWWLQQLMKFMFLVIIIVITLLLFGCSAKTITKYEPVFIPIACEVKEPIRPKASGDVIKDNIMILKYADELNVALNKCIGSGRAIAERKSGRIYSDQTQFIKSTDGFYNKNKGDK